MTKLSSTSGAGLAIGMGIGIALAAGVDGVHWGAGIGIGVALGLTVFGNVGKEYPVAVEEKDEAPLEEESHDSSSDEEE